jgi:hypothetical protein
MNKDKPLICHGTAPPAAKKEVMFFPLFEKAKPAHRTPIVSRTIVRISNILIDGVFIVLQLVRNLGITNVCTKRYAVFHYFQKLRKRFRNRIFNLLQ